MTEHSYDYLIPLACPLSSSQLYPCSVVFISRRQMLFHEHSFNCPHRSRHYVARLCITLASRPPFSSSDELRRGLSSESHSTRPKPRCQSIWARFWLHGSTFTFFRVSRTRFQITQLIAHYLNEKEFWDFTKASSVFLNLSLMSNP